MSRKIVSTGNREIKMHKKCKKLNDECIYNSIVFPKQRLNLWHGTKNTQFRVILLFCFVLFRGPRN